MDKMLNSIFLWRGFMKIGRSTMIMLLLIAILTLSCGRSLEPGTKAIVFTHGALTPKIAKAFNHLIGQFEKENPKIKIIRHELQPATDQQRVFYLLTSASKSSFFDVFELDVIWTAELAAGGLLLPLEDKLEAGWKNRYMRSALETATYNGKLYALPAFSTAGVLFYRKDLLKKHGLEAPKTWEELKKQVKLVKEKEGIEGLVFQGAKYEGLVCHFLEIYRSLGGKIKNKEKGLILDKKILTKALSHMQGLMKEGITPKTTMDMTEKEGLEQFKSGKVLFLRAWNDLEKTLLDDSFLKDKVGMVALPKFANKATVPTIGGWLLGVNPRTKHQKEAIKFIKFMAGKKAQRYLTESLGRPPTLSSLYAKKEKLKMADFQTHKKILQSAKQRPVSPNYHEFTLIIQDEVYAALTGNKKLEEAAKMLEQRLSSIKLLKKANPEFPKTLLLPSTIY